MLWNGRLYLIEVMNCMAEQAVFLTNALTGWGGPEQMKLHFPEIQAEDDAAQAVKRGGTIIVVVGNPPCNRFAGVPLAEEADLVDHYKGIKRNDKGKPGWRK